MKKEPDAEAQSHVAEDTIPQGYPLFTTLLSADKSFQVFRRFTRVRMRLLLVKQDQVSMLEHRLEALDRNEPCPLFLGSIRMDKNKERAAILDQLTTALREYDTLLEQTQTAMSMPEPERQDIRSVRDWVRGTGFNRKERAYIDHPDLLCLTPASDRAVKFTEIFVEYCITTVSNVAGKWIPFLRFKPIPMISYGTVRVLILGPLLRAISRIIAVCSITLIMFLPTLVLPRLTGVAERASASALLAVSVLVAIAFLTRAKTIELVSCGASYTAVVVALTAALPATVDDSQIAHAPNNATVEY